MRFVFSMLCLVESNSSLKIDPHQCLSNKNQLPWVLQKQILSRASPSPSSLDPSCEPWNSGAGIYLGSYKSPRISASQAFPKVRALIWTWMRTGQIRTWYSLSGLQHLAQEDLSCFYWKLLQSSVFSKCHHTASGDGLISDLRFSSRCL